MSLSARLVRFLLRISGFKYLFGSKVGMRCFVRYLRPRGERRPPAGMFSRFRISRREVAGWPLYHLQPLGETPAKHVLYLHGGAYVNVIVNLHWRFMGRLMNSTPCQVTVPLYGLAPEHGHEEAFDLLLRVYRNLLEQNAPEDIVFMGDSSGGGLVLALAQVLLDEGLPQPGGVVMLSPWLDIGTRNPAVAEVAKRDPMLAAPGAREAARMWAAGADMTSPRLSPIYGPVKGLAPLCLLIGTDDVLLPDCRLLRDRADTEGQPMVYREYESMFHAWMLLPLPESNSALRDITSFIHQAAEGNPLEQPAEA